MCHGARAVVPRGLLACFASHVALRVLATAVARDRCRVAAQLLLQNGALAPLLGAAKLTKSTPAARVAALRSLLVTVRASHALAEALAAQPDALAALLQARLPFRGRRRAIAKRIGNRLEGHYGLRWKLRTVPSVPNAVER